MNIKGMAAIVKKNVVSTGTQLEVVGTQVESLATLGFAGIAEDRISKVWVALSGGMVVTGAIIGSKLVVLAGVGAFGVGFVRGFKSAFKAVKEQQDVYDKVVS